MTARRNKKSPRRRRDNRRRKVRNLILTLIFLGLSSALTLFACCEDEPSRGFELADSDLLAVAIPDETPEITKQYTGFYVSFNPTHHVPNYVAWELTAEKANGQFPRNNAFRPDPDVYGCPTLNDYKGSGFDRGHMAPAADMKWSEQAMLDCHYLTNMCPQDHGLNGGKWNSLEQMCRTWALRDSSIVIIAGPVLTDELPRTIGASGVSVPERFFKVILAPYANPPRAIGFIMPNSPVNDQIEALAVSVDQVEAITGYDFFSALPDEVEAQVEAAANYKNWTRRKR